MAAPFKLPVRNRAVIGLLATVYVLGCGDGPTSDDSPGIQEFLTGRDVLFLKPIDPDFISFYGPGPEAYGHLRLPDTPPPHPVVVVIHGGCWVWAVSLRYMDRFAEALRSRGVATWNLEYSRVGSPGGGWPSPFSDVGAGIDHLEILAPEHGLDLSRVVVAGHSAGGLLALWAAGRAAIDRDSELYDPSSLPISGAVGLGAAGDMDALWRQRGLGCGIFPIERMMGGAPFDFPDRYAAASPAALLPTDTPFRLITGLRDDIFPPFAAEDFVFHAARAGDDAVLTILDQAAHYEPIAPWSQVWPEVERTILELLDIPER